MRAFTGEAFSSSNFFLLQTSEEHSGYTSLVKTRFLPSGDTSMLSASVGRLVSCLAAPVSTSAFQICELPLRFEMKKSVLESVDHRGHVLAVPSWVICLGSPPLSGTT